MALESSDIAIIQAMHNQGGMTPYEDFMVAEKTSHRPSNTSLWGLGLGVFGAAVGIGAWIFSGTYSASRSKANEALIAANQSHSQQMENLLANTLNAERNERITTTANQLPTLNDYITLTQSQSGSQSTTASSSALAQAEATILTQSLLGNVQQCPQKVSLYSAPQPCSCPGSCA